MLTDNSVGKEIELARTQIEVMQESMTKYFKQEAAEARRRRTDEVEASFSRTLTQTRVESHSSARWSVGFSSGVLAASTWIAANTDKFSNKATILSPTAASWASGIGILIAAMSAVVQAVRGASAKRVVDALSDPDVHTATVDHVLSSRKRQQSEDQIPTSMVFSRTEFRDTNLHIRPPSNDPNLIHWLLHPIPDGSESLVDAAIARMVSRGWLAEERDPRGLPGLVYRVVTDSVPEGNQ